MSRLTVAVAFAAAIVAGACLAFAGAPYDGKAAGILPFETRPAWIYALEGIATVVIFGYLSLLSWTSWRDDHGRRDRPSNNHPGRG